MKHVAIDNPEAWLYPQDFQEAARIQRTLASQVECVDRLPEPVRILAGIDVSNNPRDPDNLVYTAIVLLDAVSLQPLETLCRVSVAPLPYRSGFLAFREAPAVIELLREHPLQPDLLFVDGHGISHPRGLGIASQIGVLLDRPSIGVAKSLLVGSLESPLAESPGSRSPVLWQGRTLGMALRSRARANPLYISPGHRTSLETAMSWVIRTLSGYRLPEPTRRAHAAANDCRQGRSSSEVSPQTKLAL
jgi:deoxyribonuclease V